MGFLTNEDSHGLVDESGKDVSKGKCSVFVPTTPNPTSGYFIFVEKSEITRLKMSVEDTVKIIMSAGTVMPSHLSQ